MAPIQHTRGSTSLWFAALVATPWATQVGQLRFRSPTWFKCHPKTNQNASETWCFCLHPILRGYASCVGRVSLCPTPWHTLKFIGCYIFQRRSVTVAGLLKRGISSSRDWSHSSCSPTKYASKEWIFLLSSDCLKEFLSDRTCWQVNLPRPC